MCSANKFACVNHSAFVLKNAYAQLKQDNKVPHFLTHHRKDNRELLGYDIIVNLWHSQTLITVLLQNPTEGGLDGPSLALCFFMGASFENIYHKPHACPFMFLRPIYKRHRSVSCHVNDKLNLRENLQRGKHLPDYANFFKNSPPCN